MQWGFSFLCSSLVLAQNRMGWVEEMPCHELLKEVRKTLPEPLCSVFHSTKLMATAAEHQCCVCCVSFAQHALDEMWSLPAAPSSTILVVPDSFKASLASALWTGCSTLLPGGGRVKFAPARPGLPIPPLPSPSRAESPAGPQQSVPFGPSVMIPLQIPALRVLTAWCCAFLSCVEVHFLFMNDQCAMETTLPVDGGMLWSG